MRQLDSITDSMDMNYEFEQIPGNSGVQGKGACCSPAAAKSLQSCPTLCARGSQESDTTQQLNHHQWKMYGEGDWEIVGIYQEGYELDRLELSS